MNDLMSGGVLALENLPCRYARPNAETALLDVGGGTGDIAFEAMAGGCGRVAVCDINHNMLEVGRDRALDRGLPEGLLGRRQRGGTTLRRPSLRRLYHRFCLGNVTHVDRAAKPIAC